MNKKIDSKGNYLNFAGFTVLCDTLNVPEIKFFIPGIANLPSSSYHITLFNIVSGNFQVTNEFAERLALTMVCLSTISATGAQRFRKQAVSIQGSTVNVIVVPEDQFFINPVCIELGAILRRGSPPSVFHLSLGYKFQKGVTVSPQILNEISNQVPDIIETSAPVLCYFPSMLKYFPLKVPEEESSSMIFFGDGTFGVVSGRIRTKTQKGEVVVGLGLLMGTIDLFQAHIG
jgi:hypothetical protein